MTRPAGACLLCPPPSGSRTWRRADPGYRTCGDCLNRLRETLKDIAGRYRRLDATPGASAEVGVRGVPGFGSAPSASPHIVTMKDPRSKPCEIARDAILYTWDPNADHGRRLPDGVQGPEEPPGAYTGKREVWFGADGRPHCEQERPPRSVPAVLASLAGMIAEDRDMTPPTGDVDDLARWLDRQLDYVTRREWVGDVSDDLHQLVGQLKPVTGDPKAWIGDCLTQITTPDGFTQTCGTPLFAPTDYSRDDTVRCGGCGQPWPREEWEHLARQLHDAHV